MRPTPPLAPPLTTGLYYNLPGMATTGTTLTQDMMRLSPFDLQRSATFDRLASEVTVAAAGSTLRWVVYADNGRNYPGALVLDTGAVGDGGTVGITEATVNLSLAAKRYWVGCISQGGNPTIRCYTGTTSPRAGSTLAGLTSGFSAGFRVSGISGAAPATFTATVTAASQAPMVWLRAA